ncbi:unnamed protein product [Rangifer tarandus platyrhynchus]|uniref:Uncharacterized protein n=1 Tax=Rangifer tarandus platyrhynchus TaxID=3082113 RepID=A0ABN8YTZ7_RANTA|nr:unnamed protein product [Rangifer tarandus platyrhynchus]
MTVNLGRLQLFRVLNFIRPPPPARLATGFGWIRVAKNGVARAAQINQPWGQAAPGSQPPSRDEEDRSGRQARSAGATPWVSMIPGDETPDGHHDLSPRVSRRDRESLRTALAAQPTPAGCAGLIVCRGGALPSPRRSASPPHPLFSPPLAPSSSSSPPAPSCSQSAVPTHSLAPFGERCLFRARTAQTPDSRSPAGALGLSPRSGAPSTTAVLHAQRPSEVRLLPLLP